MPKTAQNSAGGGGGNGGAAGGGGSKAKKSKSKLTKQRSNLKDPMIFSMLPPIQDMATIINSRGVTLTSPPPRRKKRKKAGNTNQAVVASIDRDIASFPMAD